MFLSVKSLNLDEIFNEDLVVYITNFNSLKPTQKEYFHLVIFLPFFINELLYFKPFKISYPGGTPAAAGGPIFFLCF